MHPTEFGYPVFAPHELIDTRHIKAYFGKSHAYLTKLFMNKKIKKVVIMLVMKKCLMRMMCVIMLQ